MPWMEPAVPAGKNGAGRLGRERMEPTVSAGKNGAGRLGRERMEPTVSAGKNGAGRLGRKIKKERRGPPSPKNKEGNLA